MKLLNTVAEYVDFENLSEVKDAVVNLLANMELRNPNDHPTFPYEDLQVRHACASAMEIFFNEYTITVQVNSPVIGMCRLEVWEL